MKKILSFMLVLAMIASMACINVLALDSGDPEHVVGTYGDHANDPETSASDGLTLDAFQSETRKSSEADVVATVTTENENRYAADLVYTQMTIQIDSDAVWNVNTLKYEGTTSVYIGDKTVGTDEANKVFNSLTSTDEADRTIDGVASFTVTNYSDAAIAVSAEVTPTTDYEDHITGKVVGGQIAGVTPVLGESGRAMSDTYTASLTCDDWTATFATATGTNIVVATITFTISPVIPTN